MSKKIKMKITFFTIIEKILNETYVVSVTKLIIFDELTLKSDQKQ